MIQLGFFNYEDRLNNLSKIGDPLERLIEVVDFELFRVQLEEAFQFKSGKGSSGRPPYDGVLIFKILVLQSLYNLSDDQMEYQIKDRLSFMRFLGLRLSDRVPDAKTIWLYRERFKENNLIGKLFELFDKHLRDRGYVASLGQLVDASIIKAPHQRMTKEEKDIVKSGGVPEDWKKDLAKLSQKDMDARWFVKYSKSRSKEGGAVDFAIPYFGYKNHISIDRKHGFIRKHDVSPANQYDGRMLSCLLDKKNKGKGVWADTAYYNADNEEFLKDKKFKSQIHRKKSKGKAMPEEVKKANAERSKIRAAVEHVFAVQKCKMNLSIRTIGIARAKVKVGLANLTYNIKRLCFYEQKSAFAG